MILHSELSRRRIRSIKKLIRVNKLEVVSVLRVDKDKGTSLPPTHPPTHLTTRSCTTQRALQWT